MQGNISQGCPALLPWQVILPSGDVTVIVKMGIGFNKTIVAVLHNANNCIIYQHCSNNRIITKVI